ncbi:PREDICTED: phosphatidylinositol-binding clathrin assembly protein-like [Tauraco erythrolophus]|uniref:phosphatidylinositol-binding clathrin assembly protein-like n=1 Tax=Tauraco erythrolophus TaxID=121530 RepID=UPI000523E9BD|nr:PREDICTED: phosphatidylinositol-binding clathrin assembly protein-like [Tauraco erythrolophus]
MDLAPIVYESCSTKIKHGGNNLQAGFTPSPVAQPQPSAGLNVDFESVFGNKSSNVILDSGGFDELGGLLKPTVASQNQSLPVAKVPPNKLVSDDLDSSLANLVGNLGIGNGTTKNDVNWTQPGEKKLTGGSNWQPKIAPTTAWNAPTLNGMHFPQYVSETTRSLFAINWHADINHCCCRVS